MTRAELHVGMIVSGRDRQTDKPRRLMIVELGRRRAKVTMINDHGVTVGDPWWIQPALLSRTAN